nr:hypothetical protein [Tanacetum cinerariifolium]
MIRIILMIVWGRKGRKEERMLVNLLLDHQEKTNLSWFQFNKTIPLINLKTKKKIIFKIVQMQDGLKRSRGQQLLLKEGRDDRLKGICLKVQNPTESSTTMISTTWSTLARERSMLHLSPSTLLQGTTFKEDGRQDFFKAEINNRSPDKVYSDKRIISVVWVDVKRKWGYGSFTSIVHNIKYLMNLDEVHKFRDGTLLKIRDNLINMVSKNELGRGNKRLKGRDWSTKGIKRSNEMLDKIDQTLKRKEQLRRFEEYVGGRPKTIDPRFFVRP